MKLRLEPSTMMRSGADGQVGGCTPAGLSRGHRVDRRGDSRVDRCGDSWVGFGGLWRRAM